MTLSLGKGTLRPSEPKSLKKKKEREKERKPGTDLHAGQAAFLQLCKSGTKIGHAELSPHRRQSWLVLIMWRFRPNGSRSTGIPQTVGPLVQQSSNKHIWLSVFFCHRPHTRQNAISLCCYDVGKMVFLGKHMTC